MSESDSSGNTTVIAEGLNKNLLKKDDSQYHIQVMYMDNIIEAKNENDFPIIIGRDASKCHITVLNQTISRQHCKIEIVDGRLSVTDTSKNGTSLRFGHADEVILKQDESYPLSSRGMIKLGETFDDNEEANIYFKCI